MHRLLTSFLLHRKQNLLSYRLLVYIVMCSTLLAVISTAVQLFYDYKSDVQNIEKGIDSIEAGYLDSLASSLWKLDKDQISIQLDGIMKLPDIGYASITEIVAGKEEAVFFRGEAEKDYPIAKHFDLYYRGTLVGRLQVGATLENVYQRLIQKFMVILGSQSVKTFLVSICILIIVHFLVVRHLNTLSRFTQRLDLDNLDQDLKLEGNRLRGEAPDALDQLVDTINRMQVNISQQLEGKKKAQLALQELNEELEQRVKYRTATLKHTNDRLSSVIDELKSTKDKLVESEKMAALGELVAGVAHELNTPVGNSITMASHLSDNAERLREMLDRGQVDIPELEAFSDEVNEATQLISSNLERTAELVGSFKQVAVDQRDEMSSRFNLHGLLVDVASALEPETQAAHCSITLTGDKGLDIISYPASLELVVRNLALNSIQHGFGQGGGSIQIDIARQGDQVRLLYQDDGEGIPESILHRIFDPFVTSKRGQGSAGLGTHIIFNLVTRMLGGTIQCRSERGQGAQFEILLPLAREQAPDDEDDDLW